MTRVRQATAAAMLAVFVAQPAAADEWARDTRTGCAIWHGHPQPPAGLTLTWTGGCTDGKGSGHGIFEIFVDGESVARYQGRVVAGRAHGTGTFASATGETYVGAFRDGRFDGEGTLTMPDGSRYVGGFKAGAMHGAGRITLPDGREFEMSMGQPVQR